MIKEKISNGIARTKRKVYKASNKINAVAIAGATAMETGVINHGFCDGSSALQAAIGYLALPVGLLGGVFLIMGLISYASANTDGDGPAKKKAMNEIGGGGMLVAIAVVLKAAAGAILGALGV